MGPELPSSFHSRQDPALAWETGSGFWVQTSEKVYNLFSLWNPPNMFGQSTGHICVSVSVTVCVWFLI